MQGVGASLNRVISRANDVGRGSMQQPHTRTHIQKEIVMQSKRQR